MVKRVRFTAEGRRTLHLLHIEIQQEVKATLKKLAAGELNGQPLTGQLLGFLSIHVRNHRIIYREITDEIIVYYVGHRRTAYTDAVISGLADE